MKINRVVPLTTILLLAIIIFSAGCVDENDVYTVGMSPNYYPLSDFNKYNGEFIGLDVDILNWIAKNQGFEINFVSCYISEYKDAMDSNKIDMMCAMTVNEERKDDVDFSIPYLSGPFNVISKKGSTVTVDDVISGNAVIACQYGSAQEKWVKEHFGEDEFNRRVADGTILQCLSTGAAIVNVLSNDADAVIISRNVASEKIREYVMVQVIGDVGNVEYNSYGVSKNKPQLLEKINAGLNNLMASPEWQDMLKKYDLD